MPTLTLRAIGVSYALEGVGQSGLDPLELYDALANRYGPAVAPMGGYIDRSGRPVRYDALLLDRQSDPWPALLERIAEFVRERGYAYTSWSESPLAGRRATLHFHH